MDLSTLISSDVLFGSLAFAPIALLLLVSRNLLYTDLHNIVKLFQDSKQQIHIISCFRLGCLLLLNQNTQLNVDTIQKCISSIQKLKKKFFFPELKNRLPLISA